MSSKQTITSELCSLCGNEDDEIESASSGRHQDVSWISCDSCDLWYHVNCLSLSNNNLQPPNIPHILLQILGSEPGEKSTLFCSPCLGSMEGRNRFGDMILSQVQTHTGSNIIHDLPIIHTHDGIPHRRFLQLPHGRTSTGHNLSDDSLEDQRCQPLQHQPQDQIHHEQVGNEQQLYLCLERETPYVQNVGILDRTNPGYLCHGVSDFVPARNDRFSGFQDSIVHNLVRLLQVGDLMMHLKKFIYQGRLRDQTHLLNCFVHTELDQ